LLGLFTTLVSLTVHNDPLNEKAADIFSLLSETLSHESFDQLVFISQVVTTLLIGDSVYLHSTLAKKCITGPTYFVLRKVVGPMLYTFATNTLHLTNMIPPLRWEQAPPADNPNNDHGPHENTHNNAPSDENEHSDDPATGPGSTPTRTPGPTGGGNTGNNNTDNPFSPRAPDAPLSDDELERLLQQFAAGPERDRVRRQLAAMRNHHDEVNRRTEALGKSLSSNVPHLYTDTQAKQNEAIKLIVEEMREQRSKAMFDVEDLKSEGTSVGPIKNLKISAHVLLHRLSGRTVSTDNFVEVIKDGTKTFELKDKAARDTAMQDLDAFGYRHANDLIKAKHLRAIKCVDPEELTYNLTTWTAHYDYFVREVEETWHYFNRSVALEVDSCIRELVATEINPLHPAIQCFEMCNRYRDAIMQIKTRRCVVSGETRESGGQSTPSHGNSDKQTQGLFKDSKGVVRATRATQAHLKTQKVCWFYNLDKCTKTDCTWKHTCCIKGCGKAHPALNNHQLLSKGGGNRN
jgi:hypothetical protein